MFKYFYSLILFFSLLSCQHESHAQQWTQIPMTFSTGDTFTYWWGDAAFVTKKIGWFTSKGKIFKTTDGGYTWQLKKQMNGYLNCMFALDSLHVWTRYEEHMIVFTKDGGTHWDSVAFDSQHTRYGTGIFFFNASEGLSFGKYLYRTTNGGKNWNIINSKDSAMFSQAWSVDFVDKRYGWIGGDHPFGTDNGFISMTNDSGISWHFISPGGPVIFSLDLMDTLIGFSAGFTPFRNGGIVYSTVDGGITWHTLFLYGTTWLNDIKMLNNHRGWTCGENGTLWQTTNSGTTWELQSSGVTSELKRISVVPRDSTSYIFGDNNTLLKATLTTGISKEKDIPSSFNILQNYPNPFNPTTTIEYTLPHREHIVLDVYNLSGQKVKTLFEGVRELGVYQVNFDASSFPTGIYFIRLQTSKTVITRKMVYIS